MVAISACHISSKDVDDTKAAQPQMGCQTAYWHCLGSTYIEGKFDGKVEIRVVFNQGGDMTIYAYAERVSSTPMVYSARATNSGIAMSRLPSHLQLFGDRSPRQMDRKEWSETWAQILSGKLPKGLLVSSLGVKGGMSYVDPNRESTFPVSVQSAQVTEKGTLARPRSEWTVFARRLSVEDGRRLFSSPTHRIFLQTKRPFGMTDGGGVAEIIVYQGSEPPSDRRDEPEWQAKLTKCSAFEAGRSDIRIVHKLARTTGQPSAAVLSRPPLAAPSVTALSKDVVDASPPTDKLAPGEHQPATPTTFMAQLPDLIRAMPRQMQVELRRTQHEHGCPNANREGDLSVSAAVAAAFKERVLQWHDTASWIEPTADTDGRVELGDELLLETMRRKLQTIDAEKPITPDQPQILLLSTSPATTPPAARIYDPRGAKVHVTYAFLTNKAIAPSSDEDDPVLLLGADLSEIHDRAQLEIALQSALPNDNKPIFLDRTKFDAVTGKGMKRWAWARNRPGLWNSLVTDKKIALYDYQNNQMLRLPLNDYTRDRQRVVLLAELDDTYVVVSELLTLPIGNKRVITQGRNRLGHFQ